MLLDSARIQEQDIKWLNRKRDKKGLEPLEPIYTQLDAELCMRNFVNIGYDRPLPIADGVTLTFIDAGHILGSAQVVLDLHEFDTDRRKRLLFSGDVGRGNNELLRNPATADEVDFVIMESTYGGREHELPAQADDLLGQLLNGALEKRGKIIIPAFAVERTQQLIYVLHQLTDRREIPEVPIYVDSPLAVNATEIFRIHPECFNQEVYDFLFEKRNPFGFDNLTMVRKVKDSMALNDLDEPAIIISASGMCEAGRILHHLRNHIEDSRNTVLFVGYCAEHTLGWKIREGFKEVPILGDKFQVQADVQTLDSFSGHADRSELLDYFDAMGGSKERVWLVHGEQAQSESLQATLAERGPSRSIEVAEWKASVSF
jgi:metallo-beta-lactamase family protein